MTLKQMFIVNKDLKMTAGKIATQVAHGETLYMSEICHTKYVIMERKLTEKEDQMKKDFYDWKKDGLMKKIVLKATKEEMLLLIGALKAIDDDTWFGIVYDVGLTQVPINSMSCIVFEPLVEEEANERFGYLKLL